jgi:hypothetical protein
MSFAINDQATINAIKDAYNAQDVQGAYRLVLDAISNVTTSVVDGGVVISRSPADGVDLRERLSCAAYAATQLTASDFWS